MPLGSPGSAAYRGQRASRTLVLELGHARRATAVWTLLGVLLLGAAGWFWFDGATADVAHLVPSPPGAESCSDIEYRVHEIGPLTLSALSTAWIGGADRTEIHWGSRWEPMLLFLLAFAAFVTPRYASERATLTLDEREDRLSIARVRFGRSETTVRSLGALQHAILVDRGSTIIGQLVFGDDERIDIAAPEIGGGTGRLVQAVNDFIAPRA